MSVATFPLIEDAPAPSPVASTGIGTLAPIDQRTAGMGLVTPIRRSKLTDFAVGSGIDIVRSAIGQIIGTRADDGRMTGELPWRTDFGSIIHRMLYMGVDETFQALLRSRIISAVAAWEPRARIRDVKILKDTTTEGGTAVVARVYFDVVQESSSTVLVSNQQLDIPLSS